MKVSHRKQDRVDQQTRIRVGTQMGLKSGSKAMGSRQGSPALLFDLQSYSFPHLCLSGACHFSLNCCHDLCSDGRKTTKQSEFYTAQLLLSAQTQNHVSQNKFQNAGSYFNGPGQHLHLVPKRCSESALTCQHPLSPDGQAEVKRGRGCCSDLNNGPQRYPGSNLWNL